ncbi:cupin domain-containing protein [Elongatibacter sediminis]|uniref:Cupin domain-containing protein n=1 Tax=Elongatibacter sediminis TaxID=3119006 RepID=A0AAW9R4X9_9GAMM
MGTRRVLENEKVIVSELVLEPGESTGKHRHELDYVVYVIDGATLRATDGNGEDATDVTLSAGDTFHFQIRGDRAISGELETTAVHNAENVSTATYREIMVELK